MAEQLLCTQEVVGSSPVFSTGLLGCVAEWFKVSVLKTVVYLIHHRFESCRTLFLFICFLKIMVLLALKPLISGAHSLKERTSLMENGVRRLYLTNFNTLFRTSGIYNLYLLFLPNQNTLNNLLLKEYQLLGYFLNPYLLDSSNYKQVTAFSTLNLYPGGLVKTQILFLLFFVKLQASFVNKQFVQWQR